MRKLLLILLVFGALLLLVSLKCVGQLVGTVVSVSDGDTFTMQVEKKQVNIKLYGIDCPEANQDFGDTAKKFVIVLFRFVGDTVRVTKMGKDMDGKILGIAYAALQTKFNSTHFKNLRYSICFIAIVVGRFKLTELLVRVR